MKQVLSFTICLISLATTSAFAGSPQLDFAGRFAKQIDFAENNQEKVWSGFHPGSTASMIQFSDVYNNKQSAYAFNFKPQLPSWQALTSLGYPVYYLADSTVLNIHENQNGQLMQVDGQLSYIDIEYESFIAEENLENKFMLQRARHYIKHEAKIDPKNADFLRIPYASFNDTNLLKLFYLEDSALTLAQQDDPVRAEAALQDAVAIHQYRDQLSSQDARDFENGNEIINGIPAYISWTSRQLSEADYRKMTQRTGCRGIESLSGAMGLIYCITNGLPAFSGAVYGHALDKKLSDTSWKQEVESAFKSSSRTAIDYYHFTSEQAQHLTQKALQNPEYHYDRISRVIDHVMTPYLENLHRVEAAYQQASGIELHTNYPLGFIVWLVSIFLPAFDDMYTPTAQSVLFEKISLLISGTESNPDDYLEINLPSMYLKFAIKSFSTTFYKAVTTFKIANDAVLILDGKKIDVQHFMQKDQKQSFQKFVLSAEGLRIPMDIEGIAGTIESKDGMLNVMFEYTPEQENSLKQKILQPWLKKYPKLKEKMNAKKILDLKPSN